jgi:predicted N-acetyltransferase YhbS
MSLRIVHLFDVPQYREAVAALIHHEFWTQVPGASVQRMAERLLQAARADAVPLCRVALLDGQPAGVVNLVDNDNERHTEWHPWLAGMVVAADHRGHGIGSTLVRTLLDDARRLGFERVYFGTDGPGFYTRLGAVVHEQPRPDFWFMRFELGG